MESNIENYHKELVDKIYDYCIAWKQQFTPEDLALRNSKGWISTSYTACPDAMPNVGSNNEPIEATYLPLYCIANGFNGFLRWAWMNWTDNPMYDSCFKLFTPGDTYIVYPGNHSSRRFEHIIRGVQNVAKIETLRKEYKQKRNQKALQLLEDALSQFKDPTPNEAELRESIYKIESLLNK